jgi:hypothetical protein
MTLAASYEQLLGARGTEIVPVAEEAPVKQADALAPEATNSIPAAAPLQTVSLPLPIPAARPKLVAPPLPMARPRIGSAPLPIGRPAWPSRRTRVERPPPPEYR